MYIIENVLNLSCSILVPSHVLILRIAEKLVLQMTDLIGIYIANFSIMYELKNAFEGFPYLENAFFVPFIFD